MKKRFTTKFMSIALLLSVVTVIFPLTVSADEDSPLPEDYSQYIVEEEPFEFEYLPGDLTHEELKTAVLNPAEKPAVVSKAQIDGMQHVNRLYEQEPDEYTVIFQNRDGGKTVYVFDRPVKSVSESGEVCDLSANAIVVASKKNTQLSSFSLNNAAGESISAPVSAMKQMQARLEAYKSALGLNEYQMLDDVFETETLTARGLASELSSPMQITESDSVSVANLSVTYLEFGGIRPLKVYSGNIVLAYNGASGLTMKNTVLYNESWIFVYQGYATFAIRPVNNPDYYMYYLEGTSVSFEYFDSEPGDEYCWTVNINSSGYYTLYQNGKYLYASGSMSNTSTNWAVHHDFEVESVRIQSNYLEYLPNSNCSIPAMTVFPSIATYNESQYFSWYSSNSDVFWEDENGNLRAGSAGVATLYCRHIPTGEISNTVTVIVSEPLDIVSGRTHIIRSYASTIDDLKTNPLLTMNVSSSGSTSLSLNSFYVETAQGQTGNRWNNKVQAFTFTQNDDGSYRITAIMSTNQYNVAIWGPAPFEHTDEYYLVDKNTCPNTLVRNETQVTLNTYNTIAANTSWTENAKWYVYKENGATYICTINNGTVSYLNHNNLQTLSENKTNSDWSVTFVGVDAPAVKQVNYYFCGVASTLQTLITIGKAEFEEEGEEEMDLREKQLYLNDTDYIKANSSSGANKERMTATLNAFSNSLQYINVEYDYNSAGLYTMSSTEKTLFKTRLINTLLAGSPVIFHEENPLPYYDPTYTDGHYITVIGYDPATENVIVSDVCYWSDFGIHAISFESLCARCKSGYIYAE